MGLYGGAVVHAYHATSGTMDAVAAGVVHAYTGDDERVGAPAWYVGSLLNGQLCCEAENEWTLNAQKKITTKKSVGGSALEEKFSKFVSKNVLLKKRGAIENSVSQFLFLCRKCI